MLFNDKNIDWQCRGKLIKNSWFERSVYCTEFMNDIHNTCASYTDLKLSTFRTTMFRPKVKNYRMESFMFV